MERKVIHPKGWWVVGVVISLMGIGGMTIYTRAFLVGLFFPSPNSVFLLPSFNWLFMTAGWLAAIGGMLIWGNSIPKEDK